MVSTHASPTTVSHTVSHHSLNSSDISDREHRKTDYNLSTSWSFVKIFWNSAGASIYSCPDFFRLPGSDTYVFGSLDAKYWLGKYGHDAKGLPEFQGPKDGATASVPNGTL